MTRIKVCGITNVEDALIAARAGADAIGLVFAPSPRKIECSTAQAIRATVPPFTAVVGVFVNESPGRVIEIARMVGLSAVQLHGDEPPEEVREVARALPVIKGISVKGPSSLDAVEDYPQASAYLFDTYVAGVRGGTGKRFNWDILSEGCHRHRLSKPWILAGGLNPENVERAVRDLKPYAVDVSSGVEARVGEKEPQKVREFILKARRNNIE